MAIQTPINTPANGAAGGGGAGGSNPYLNPPPAPGRPTAAAAATTTTPANQHHNDSNSNSFHHQNNNNNNNFSDSTAISHLSISGASSSGLDGSLAGFSLFGRALPPPSGSQSQPQQAQTQGPRSTMMQHPQQQPRRVLPSNGIFGTQSHAALAAMLASSQSESSLVSASGETGTGGESSFSASLSFPNRVGGRPTGAHQGGGGGGGGRGGAGNNLGLVPTNGPWPGLLAPGSQARTHSIPMLSSSTPALTQGSAAAAGTSMSAMSQQSTSQADQAHSGGGIASSSRTQQLYHQHDSQTMGGVGGETQHSLFPANSTSADSMMHSYDEQDEVEKENRVQTELQHLSNARGRDLHLKAHIQLGLSIPTAKAPILDPLVQIILPESASTRTQPSAPGPALLPLPLPSPAETASLRDRAYLAQRRTQIRESLVRSHVLVELDNIALEHDRQRLRTAIQEQSKRWAANRELKRRRKMAGGGSETAAAAEEDGKEGERSQGEIVPSSSWSTVDGGGPEGSAPVEVNSGPSALTPHQRSELKTLLRASPGLDGKAAGSQPHRNAVAMLNNENRHASFFLQQQVASSEPLLTDWAYAPPAPGSYSSTTTTARRTLSAAAPPVVRKPSHQNNDADDSADDDDDDDGKKSLLLLLGASNRKDGSASSEAWFFSSRQRGAELGSFAPAWDVGPCGSRLRNARELEECGWGQREVDGSDVGGVGVGGVEAAGMGSRVGGASRTRWGRR